MQIRFQPEAEGELAETTLDVADSSTVICKHGLPGLHHN